MCLSVYLCRASRDVSFMLDSIRHRVPEHGRRGTERAFQKDDLRRFMQATNKTLVDQTRLQHFSSYIKRSSLCIQ